MALSVRQTRRKSLTRVNVPAARPQLPSYCLGIVFVLAGKVVKAGEVLAFRRADANQSPAVQS